MNKSFLARSLHKWFGLIVGLQVLIWLATGLYMVVLDLDFIHGDPLVRNMLTTVTVPGSSRVSVAALRAQYVTPMGRCRCGAGAEKDAPRRCAGAE